MTNAVPETVVLGFKARNVTALEDDDLILEGVASNLERDAQGETVTLAALKQAAAQAPGLPIYFAHRKHMPPLGIILAAEVVNGALHVKARLDGSPPGSWAADIVNRVRAGLIGGLSIGGSFTRSGKRIIGIRLSEVSVASKPVLASARIASVTPHRHADHPDAWNALEVAAGRALLSLDKLKQGAAEELAAEDAAALPLDRARLTLRAQALHGGAA